MSERRIDGIEWLRAVMSVFVVAWHLGGGGKSLIWSADWQKHVFTASDFVNFHILLLAVPSFMLISNYLLAIVSPDSATTLRRAQRVGALLLFWPLMFMIYQSGFPAVGANIPVTASEWLYYTLTAGWTVYYFFVSVLITYALTFFAAHLSTTVNIVLLVLMSVLMGVAPLATAAYDWPYLSAYWSPVNFLAFPFAGIVITRLLGRDAPARRALAAAALLVVLGAMLSVVEWRIYPHASLFPGQGYAFPAYTRPSLIALSMALLIGALRLNVGLPPVVAFMAKYSLALYCLHLFAAEPLRLLVNTVASGWSPLGQAWLLIALTIPASYLAAKALSLAWRDRLLF